MAAASIVLHELREYRIGRGQQCDLVLLDPAISRLHLILKPAPNGWILQDAGSSTGTWMGEQRLLEHPLQHGDVFRIGIERLRFEQDHAGARLDVLDAPSAIHCPWPADGWIHLGRGSGNTISIAHPRCPHRLQSFQRQGLTVPTQLHYPIGSCDIQESGITWTPAPLGLEVTVENLGVEIPGRTLLQGIQFSLHCGELLAIIGRSGQGKSTLLQCLSGQRISSHGDISLGQYAPGDARLRSEVALLAQDAPLHPWLTVTESLQDAATLQLPRDMSKEELCERAQTVLREVGLQHVAHNRTTSLSGGEQRRAALAQQLLSGPSLVLLDEPFAGLDPLSVEPLASWFRQLSWGGQTLILTTHDYAIWSHCDKVLILQEGYQAYFGTPDNALAFFNARHPGEILQKLQGKSGADWQESFRRAHPGSHPDATLSLPKHSALSTAPATKRVQSKTRSAFPVLLGRFSKSVWRDRGRLRALLLQPLVIGLLMALLFDSHSSLWVAAFALNLCANWFAMSGAIREVIQEKPLVWQEMRQGLSPIAYLSSKFIGLGMIAAVQTLFCIGILVVRLDLHPAWSSLAPIALSLLAAPLCAGLAVSTLSRSSGQANALLPLLLIPQLMFAGALVPLDRMHPVGQVCAHLLWSSWNQNALQAWFLGNPVLAIDLQIPLLMSVGIAILCKWAARPTTKKVFHGSSTRTMI